MIGKAQSQCCWGRLFRRDYIGKSGTISLPAWSEIILSFGTLALNDCVY